jgi:hypothetical protein
MANAVGDLVAGRSAGASDSTAATPVQALSKNTMQARIVHSTYWWRGRAEVN